MLNPGTTLRHYRIIEKIGEGGMGEVYRARDDRLNRDVALKVLPAAFATNTERMARFQREAQLLASLNHPNIGSIYGLEEADGIRCLVLELVEGETLAERIAQGPVPVEEALRISRQIAEALEAAHERGITHRDLKPGNAKVTPEGTVKVLDFGLAKAFEGDAGSTDISKSPTLTTPATQQGVILGTAAYMSPEQARGRPVDTRADVWAFGCVLYEILVGKQAFEGDTVSDMLASVLKTEPDWQALPGELPPPVHRLLRRCLEKDPRRRLQAIGEARLALEDFLAGRLDAEPAVAAAPAPPRSLRQSFFLAVGVVVVAAVAGVLAWTLKPAAPGPPLLKFNLAVETLPVTAFAPPGVISPDGLKIAYVGEAGLWLREFDQLEPRRLASAQGASHPFWSPDSAYVGFVADGKLWKVSATGGDATLITDLRGSMVGGSGLTWGPEDRIVFSRGNTGLFEVSALGGDFRPLLEINTQKESDLHQPHFLPGGRGILYVPHLATSGSNALALLAEGKTRILFQLEDDRIWDPVYSPTGHILYGRQAVNPGVWAVPFSLDRLEVTGEPFLVVSGAGYVSASDTGNLAYLHGVNLGQHQLVWVNRRGEIEGTISQPQQVISQPSLSPDGRRVVAMALENENWDLWVHDTRRGTRTRLTFTRGMEWGPQWSPDGERVLFEGSQTSIVLKAADGSGQGQILAKGETPSYSKDGKFLAYAAKGEDAKYDIWYFALGKDARPIPFFQTPASEFYPEFSPDGRFLAYVSDESGREELYIKRFPGGEGKWQVSVNGGTWPRWRGNKIFYREGGSLMEVEVSTRPSLTLGTPRRLFTSDPREILLQEPTEFDVSADGRRFVFVQAVRKQGDIPSISIVQNWFAEFRGRE